MRSFGSGDWGPCCYVVRGRRRAIFLGSLGALRRLPASEHVGCIGLWTAMFSVPRLEWPAEKAQGETRERDAVSQICLRYHDTIDALPASLMSSVAFPREPKLSEAQGRFELLTSPSAPAFSELHGQHRPARS